MALVGDDCFFYLNSGCVRGGQCSFRHQPAARSTTVVCPQWLQRCCFHPNCGLRHTDDRSHRNQTPCFFESNMGVCYKPRCTFVHTRKPAVHVASIQVPLPVLPPHPPVLPALPPLLPPNPSIGIPPPLNLPPPAVGETPAVVEKPAAALGNEAPDSAGPQIIRAPLTPPPPVLPPPSKLAEMLLGSRPPLELAPTPKAAVTPPNDQRPAISTQEVVSAPPAQNVSILGAPPPVTVFPKNEHFNEQVRLFKEMLASKGYSDEEKTGGTYKVKERQKERQRSKREHKEKEGYTSHKGSKTVKEVWSKADEEILYGDYKDVPLDKKSKKKKRKAHKEHPDSDPEVKVKSYEEILREKALRKMFFKRKEKFNEDFKELLNDNIVIDDESLVKTNRIDEVIIPTKSYQKNKFIPDKVVRKNKKYNSDGDEVEYSDESKEGTEGNFKRRNPKSDVTLSLKQAKKHAERRSRKDNEESEYHSKTDDIKDVMLKNAIIDSQRRQSLRHLKNDSKKNKHRDRRVDEVKKYDLIEIKCPSESRKEKNVKVQYEKIESSPEAEYVKESSSDETDSDSDSDSESSDDDSSSSCKEEIIIPDETTNIDFTVDHDDDLAMEINQNEKSENLPAKTKKISSVVSVINKVPSSFDKTKYHKKFKERDVTEFKSVGRHHKSNEHDFVKKDSKSKDRNHGRKSPRESNSNNLEKPIENKKVVRLVNTSNEPLVTGRVTPPLVSIKNDGETSNKKPISPVKSSTVKVKSFEEIMAEKQRRNKNLITEPHEVVSISDSPIVSKSFNATLKEKSTQAKLEILDVPKKQNGNSLGSSGVTSNSLGSSGVTKSIGKPKVLTDEEKQKRKSLQLYKPPHPAKPENEMLGAKTTEIKMVVNTGPRKIIRIRKASLSTDLIDQQQPCAVENVDITTPHDGNDEKQNIKVRSFDDIIREKRARQKKERELAKQLEKEANQMEKENASFVAPVTSTSNNLLRRKPVLRRHAPPTVPSTTNSISSTLGTVVASSVNITVTTTNSDLSNEHAKTLSDNKRPVPIDSNIAKVPPLVKVVPQKRSRSELSNTPTVTPTEALVVPQQRSKSELSNTPAVTPTEALVVPQKRSKSHLSNPLAVTPTEAQVVPQRRSKSDLSNTPVVTPTEALENKDFYSRLRNLSSRRTSVSSACSTVKDGEKTTVKLRKRSITSTVECSSVSSNHVTTQKISPYKFDTSVQSPTSNETNVETHVSSRKDIQEALDEEKRKREQDILSDDEFEKEINELGSDDDGDDIDDINEDDLLMELEQMIDS